VLTTNGQRESTQDLAAKVFAELRTLLLSFEEGALKGDVESIHDMRVTTRRFRVALSNFAICVPQETRQRVKTDVNQLADTLGKVRDIDVMLDSLTVIEELSPSPGNPSSRIFTPASRAAANTTNRAWFDTCEVLIFVS